MIVHEELVDLSWVRILLSGLDYTENVPLENGNLVPVVQNLGVVHLDLTIKLLDLGPVSLLLLLGVSRLAESCSG